MGLIVAALAATITFHPALEAEASEEQRVIIEIRKFKFVPEALVVSPGDVVVWKNMDIVPHTATSTNGGWDSGAIEAGGEWETVVTEDMSDDYFCVFHPSMIATVGIESD